MNQHWGTPPPPPAQARRPDDDRVSDVDLIALIDPPLRRAFHVAPDGHISIDETLTSRAALERLGEIGLRERRGQRLSRGDQALSDLLRRLGRHDLYIGGAVGPILALREVRRDVRLHVRVYGRPAREFYAAEGMYARLTPRLPARRESHRQQPGHRRRAGARSSARSGDSGDSDLADADPPGGCTFRAFDALIGLSHALPEHRQREAWRTLSRIIARKAAI
jgi:hypothetical protein